MLMNIGRCNQYMSSAVRPVAERAVLFNERTRDAPLLSIESILSALLDIT
jgi:hypothetical protein